MLTDSRGTPVHVGCTIEEHDSSRNVVDIGRVTSIEDNTIFVRWMSTWMPEESNLRTLNFIVVPTPPEVAVTLNTACGDVVTSYPIHMINEAIDQFRGYVLAGQKATISY